MSAKFLNAHTIHPGTNSGGDVVWNTRYYLEALLTAYQATNNPKYLTAFLDSATNVMSLITTTTVSNAPVPINPADVASAPKISVVGFTSLLASFSYAVPIPTSTGGVSMWAQNLQPTNPVAAVFLQVAPLAGGGVTVSWLDSSEKPLESHNVTSMADLTALQSLPLIALQSLGRFEVTGAGMPAPGLYTIDTAQPMIWVEQTAGILLPITRFLLLAKNNPQIADASLVADWTSKIAQVAASSEASLIPDGSGGVLLHNPQWLANPLADVNASMDYVSAEGAFRIVFYELTGDSHQLDLARELITHQARSNWPISNQGWLLLKNWPDFQQWTDRSGAPAGSIYDQFIDNNTTPAPILDGEFNAEMFQTALQYKLSSTLGISDDVYTANKNTVLQYLFLTDTSKAIIRAGYPYSNSTTSDKENPASDPYASAGYLTEEVSNNTFVITNWNWFLQYGDDPTGLPVGYFLRAWARSESAALSTCQSN